MSKPRWFSPFVHRSLYRRVFLIGGGTLMILCCALTLLFHKQVRDSVEREFQTRGRTLTHLLATQAWLAHQVQHDPDAFRTLSEQLQLQTQSLIRDEHVVYASVRDLRGQTLASSLSGIDPDISFGSNLRDHAGLRFELRLCREHSPFAVDPDPLTHRDCTPMGSVGLGISAADTLAQLNRTFLTILGVAVLLAAITLGSLLGLTRWALQPVTSISAVARRVAGGDLAARVDWDGQDEIGELAAAFNDMTWSLATSQDELNERNRELQLVVADKERLYQNTRTRATRLEVMNELTKAIASSLEPQEIYSNVHHQLERLMQFEYFTVQRFLPDRETMRRDYTWLDAGTNALQQGSELSLNSSPVRRVQETKKPMSIPDFSRDPLLAEGWLFKEGFRSGLLVPLVAQNEFLGCLGMACRRRNAFDSAEVATVFAVAEMLAVMVKNAELYQKLQISYLELQDTQKRLMKSEHMKRSEKMRSIGQMTSGIAHNFNNVMSAIIGRVQLMKMKASRNAVDLREILSSMDVIEQAALDGADTVRRLQEFSRDSKSLSREQCDLNDLIRSVLEITSPRWKDQAQQQGVRIELDTRLESLPPVACVPGQFREVLTNLVFNAVDAMPRGGTLTIGTRQEDLCAVIRVTDTGIGMPEEVRERIFEPFYTTKGVSGSGLGLSTVYGIIKRHAGEIQVESAEGKGTTFEIRLPFAQVTAPKSLDESMEQTDPWRILVGDDEDNVREALADLLQILGHEVHQAADGTSTVEAFRENRFDMVFTDLGMPDMSGWEVAETIRGLDPRVPIVLATGWGAQIDHVAEDRGVTRVLAKPFTVQKLASLIAELQNARKAA